MKYSLKKIMGEKNVKESESLPRKLPQRTLIYRDADQVNIQEHTQGNK